MENKPFNAEESLWRRTLSAAERDALRTQPGLELEARLTAALAKIPDAPVPSNFTARVMADIELEEIQATRPQIWALNWRLLWPRVAVAAAILIFAGVSLQRYETNAQRTALAKNLALAARAPSPGVDALENLDAIQLMGQSGHADGQLLAALQ
jgi:negative regulator of sigma E activity